MPGGEIMAGKKSAGGKPHAAKPLWAYGYEIIPSQPKHPMDVLRGLVSRHNTLAAQGGRTWTARLVTQRVVHVLVVSADPELDVESNRALEAELTGMGIKYVMTLPMRVDHAPDMEPS